MTLMGRVNVHSETAMKFGRMAADYSKFVITQSPCLKGLISEVLL